MYDSDADFDAEFEIRSIIFYLRYLLERQNRVK